MGYSLRNFKANKILKVIGEDENQIIVYNINCSENEDRRNAIYAYINNLYQNKISKMEIDINNDEDIEILGKEVLKNIMPILTDLDFTDISDEEIESILMNPSDELLEAKDICEDIILKISEQIKKAIEIELKNIKLIKELELNNFNKKNKYTKSKQQLLEELKEKEEAKKREEAKQKEIAELEAKLKILKGE